MDTLNILKQIVESSAQLSNSALAIFGGTIVTILGTSYRRPVEIGWRLPFLLFVPGWICLGLSMYQSNVIESRYLAAIWVKQSEWLNIAELVNSDYASQRMWLLLSLAFFGAWLIGYLLYWVLAAIPEKGQK